jgi:hypothetical protein
MFQAQIITVCFLTMFGAIFVFNFFEKRHRAIAEKAALILGLVAGVYCIAAGAFLLSGWQDPFAAATAQQLGHVAGSHGGRGGIVILAIRFWPYVLIGFGAFSSYHYLAILKSYA